MSKSEEPKSDEIGEKLNVGHCKAMHVQCACKATTRPSASRQNPYVQITERPARSAHPSAL
ncbi:Uncharacterized protein BM_BM17506 [Brugia malayi]|uniref:Uncharacterized protein n=1 Tax=Brugia malayi TaxID=6279 RepID=A0A4E9FGN8_BRUMA|nr:Uncharacterized protein BM_BM17506 [Brugia malayi]VIO93940.1 Uncharacterized protein BM_BM17506 [Brugia malayi]